MKKRTVLKALVLALSVSGAGLVAAQDQLKTQDKDQDRLRDQDGLSIYGYELMTEQERTALRERMRATKTQQERERIWAEHRVPMDARAKERGVAIVHRDGSSGASQGSSGSGSGAGGKK